MSIPSVRVSMQVEYSNVEILQGLAGEMCREEKYEKAFQTLFNASRML